MSTSTQRHTETVAHAFADLMNGHDPDAVDGWTKRAEAAARTARERAGRSPN